MSSYTKSTDFASKDALLTGNPLKVVKGTELDDEFNSIQTAVNSKADTNSPALIGTPTAPTAAASTNTTQIATTAMVQGALNQSGIIDTAQLVDDAVTANKLANTAVTADTYGDATNIAQITVDAQGRITDATEIAVADNRTILQVQGATATPTELDQIEITVLTKTITPSANTSKILISFSGHAEGSGGSNQGYGYSLYRGSSEIYKGINRHGLNNSLYLGFSGVILDSPTTTNELTYSIKVYGIETSSEVDVNGFTQSIILQEVRG